MGVIPCSSTITTESGTVIMTTFSPLNNTFTITINPSSPLVTFCIDLPCVSFGDFTCTDGFACEGICTTAPGGNGIGANPLQTTATPLSFTYTFNSSVTLTAGAASANFLYSNGTSDSNVQLPCAPVCS
ncbi:hypothetical protein V7122_12765 [Bacillus sp. JJ1532]|uniref:hypothetical protein n=1 Tax=Bacillus sp. JJ1532 TaxID=3122958 RepID=UPI0030002CC6